MFVNGQLRYAGLEQLTADPTTELFQGRIYFNTTTLRVRVYDQTNGRWADSTDIEAAASDPTGTVGVDLYTGRMYYNTTLDQIKVYDEDIVPAGWKTMTPPIQTGQENAHLRSNGDSADSMEWTFQNHMERLAGAPVSNLYLGRTYWDTTLDQGRIYGGSGWQTFTPPIQTSNANRHLRTDGTDYEWTFENHMERLATAPVTNLYEGRTYWDTTLNQAFIYNSGAFEPLSTPTEAGNPYLHLRVNAAATAMEWTLAGHIERLAADPVSDLYAGRTYYNTTDLVVRHYTGSVWVTLTTPALAGEANKHLAVNSASGAMEWTFRGHMEELAGPPVSNLYAGRSYYHTGTKDAWIYHGGVWRQISFPDVSGNAGFYLFTDGSAVSWASVAAATLPPQAGEAGKFLFTNGTNESWEWVRPQFNQTLLDNQAAPVDITGALYSSANYNGVKLGYVIDRTDGATPRSAIGELWLRYDTNNSTWNIHRANEFGDYTGVEFQITGAGQLTYTSDTMGGTYSGEIHLSEIVTMGNQS